MKHRIMQKGLKVANAFVSFIVFCLIAVAVAYSLYALWDNNRIYTAADNVSADLLSLKPMSDNPADNKPSFDELRAINPDVCAWLTLDNTQIDHPIVQGKDNLEYVNRDIYGEFSLAGCIFLDSYNSSDFSDPYSLVYGHHMEKHKMFGDLELYKEPQFFSQNKTGKLITVDKVFHLKIFACMVVPAGEDTIFSTQTVTTADVIAYASQKSVNFDESVVSQLNNGNLQVLAMSTCSTEYSDARTVVLAIMN